MTNINTTGSHWKDGNGDHWSYDTQLTGHYKGHFFFNSTYYSETTCKHQSYSARYFRPTEFETLRHCRYGKQDWKQCIKDEIEYITSEVNTRLNKCKTQKNKETIEQLLKKQLYLQSILDEVTANV